MNVGTPQPHVTLVRTSLNSLSIRWSVNSIRHITGYTVYYWSGPFTEMNITSANIIQYTISGLASNTPYNVKVEANGPLGSKNSTTQQFFTYPKGDTDFTEYNC